MGLGVEGWSSQPQAQRARGGARGRGPRTWYVLSPQCVVSPCARSRHALPSSHAIEAPVHVPLSALGPPLGLKSTWMVGGRPVPEETDARTVQGGPSASLPLTAAAVAFAMMERGQPG